TDLIASARAATAAVEAVLSDATRAVAARVTQDGRISSDLLDRAQRAAHGLSWFATYVEAIRQLAAYTERMSVSGRFGELDARLVALMREHHGATVGDCGLDETLEAIRAEMHKFAESEVVPHAHAWHLTNSYIPLKIVAQMSELGVFGLTIPEEYGGMGLGKE